MTQFNPENKETLTYQESLSPAMQITDEEDAKQYLRAYINFLEKIFAKDPPVSQMTAEEYAKINLAYYAGYYSNETRERVERLFQCEHPVFGSIAEYGAPSADVAFAIGKSMGRNAIP